METPQQPQQPKKRRHVLWIVLGGLVVICLCLTIVVAQFGTKVEPTVQPAQPAVAVVTAAPKTAQIVTADAPHTATPLPAPTFTPTEAPTPAPAVTETPLPPKTPTPAPIPTYLVLSVDDISASAVRFRAVVTTEFPISVEQINRLCEQVVEDIKSQAPSNAVVVFLYDTRSVLSIGYSIAKCEYAPNGVWTDAVNVQTGDYSTHKFTYEYQPKVYDSQTALLERPTEQEYDLCQQWFDLAFELLSESDDVEAETIVFEQIAEKNAVSVQTVDEATFKCNLWALR